MLADNNICYCNLQGGIAYFTEVKGLNTTTTKVLQHSFPSINHLAQFGLALYQKQGMVKSFKSRSLLLCLQCVMDLGRGT